MEVYLQKGQGTITIRIKNRVRVVLLLEIGFRPAQPNPNKKHKEMPTTAERRTGK
jgi:hypothetical protein